MRKLFLFTIAVAIGLVACDKKSEMLNNNTDSSVRSKAPVSNNIRYFNSYEELSEEIDRVNAMSFDDLVAYEAELDFNSFGKLADMAYAEVAQYQDEYENIEDVKGAIAQHSEYLQLIKDEQDEYLVATKLYRSGTKYIVNGERMYQVQDTLIKILENAIIEAHIEHYETLLKINEGNVGAYVENNPVGILITIFCLKCPFNSCTCNGHNPPSGSYIGKERTNYEEELIKVDGKYRYHKLIVKVKMDPVGGKNEKTLYIFDTRRKGITNGAYWAYGMDVFFDLSASFGKTSHPNGGGNLLATSSPVDRYGTARTSGCGLCWTTHKGNFLETNTSPPYHLEERNNVFVTTRGYARCYAHGVEIKVPFDYN